MGREKKFKFNKNPTNRRVTRSVTNQLAELNARQEIVEANGGIPLTNRIFQSQVNIGFNVQLESLLFQQRPARTIRRRHSTQMNVEQVQRPIRNRRSSTDIRTYVAPDDLRAVIGNIRQYLNLPNEENVSMAYQSSFHSVRNRTVAVSSLSSQEQPLSDHEPIDMDVESNECNPVVSDSTVEVEFQEPSMDIDEVDSINDMEFDDNTTPTVHEVTIGTDSRAPFINMESEESNSVASQLTFTNEPIMGPLSISHQRIDTLNRDQLIQLRDSLRSALGLGKISVSPTLNQSTPMLVFSSPANIRKPDEFASQLDSSSNTNVTTASMTFDSAAVSNTRQTTGILGSVNPTDANTITATPKTFLFGVNKPATDRKLSIFGTPTTQSIDTVSTLTPTFGTNSTNPIFGCLIEPATVAVATAIATTTTAATTGLFVNDTPPLQRPSTPPCQLPQFQNIPTPTTMLTPINSPSRVRNVLKQTDRSNLPNRLKLPVALRIRGRRVSAAPSLPTIKDENEEIQEKEGKENRRMSMDF